MLIMDEIKSDFPNPWREVDKEPPPVGVFLQVFVDHTVNPQDLFIMKMLKRPLRFVTVAQVCFYDTYNEHEWNEESHPRWMLTIVGGGPSGTYNNITHWKHLELEFPK